MAVPPLHVMLPAAMAQSHASSVCTPRRRRVPVETLAENEELVRSLQIKTDKRYIAMNHFREHCGTTSDGSHFARLIKKSTGGKKGHFHGDLKNLESTGIFSDRLHTRPVGCIEDRVEWQESFDHRVRRLLVDFQLSDVPSCRLKHLDRMHAWFEEHGAKQTRKSQPGPNFLTADRSSSMPAGSTKNLPTGTSMASQLLSSAFKNP